MILFDLALLLFCVGNLYVYLFLDAGKLNLMSAIICGLIFLKKFE